jgi:hypothetical protein
MKRNILSINIKIPMFIIYRLSMELQDPEQLLQTVIDVIKYASCGISPDRLIVSPELWEWIKTEIDKYNSFQSPM